nr:DUF3103 family protein [Vibrio coralliirubri]
MPFLFTLCVNFTAYWPVNGIKMSVNSRCLEPQIDLVEMPYLDYDKQTYYPNQTVIFWPRYRWGAGGNAVASFAPVTISPTE